MTSEEEIKELNLKLMTECKNQDLGKIKELIANGAQANYVKRIQGTWGAYKRESVLHAAMQSLKKENEKTDVKTWKEIILLLLKSGSDPNEKYEDYDWRGCGTSQSVFDLMGSKMDSDLFTAIIKAGLDPNLVSVTDRHSMRTDGCAKSNLLHNFSRSGNVDFVVVLLEAGADVDVYATENVSNERGYRENRSETALHLAASNDHLQVCIFLLAKGADINKMHTFIDSNLNEEIENSNRTDDPRDENYKNPWENVPVECTALHLALKESLYDLAKFLLAAGANHQIPYKRGDKKISCFDLFSTGVNSTIEKEEALKNALSGKMSLESLIKSMTPGVGAKVLSSLAKVQDLGWEMDNYNFGNIFKSLKPL